MAVKITGTGSVAAADFHDVKWVGTTKGGKAVTIEIKEAASDTTENWSIEIEGSSLPEGADSIILGAGKLYIGQNLVALSRGGGSFNVTREYRRINADGDRGPVKGRVVMETSEATLTMNVLTVLASIADLYTSIETSV